MIEFATSLALPRARTDTSTGYEFFRRPLGLNEGSG
jgi:hypothetical protein